VERNIRVKHEHIHRGYLNQSGDLRLAYEQRKEFTTLSELKQIQDLLNSLESRVGNLNQVLSRLDSRRGLLDLGGNVLRSSFVVATIAELQQLHLTLDELK